MNDKTKEARVSQEDVIALLERAASDEVFRVRLRMVLNRRLTEALVFGFLMPHRAETPKTRSQQHLARRATPVLESIHHIS
jgi:hypothetical protein